MPFTDRFQLLDLKRDEGARTYEAREIATGRPVYVHVFADTTAPLNRALLAKLDNLPEEELRRIIDRGPLDVGVYVVTDRLAEYPGLREWLKAKNQDRPKPLEARGAWQFNAPAQSVPAPPPAPPPLAAPPKADDAGEFTRLFTSPLPPPRERQVEAGPPPVPPVSAPPIPKLSNSEEPTIQVRTPPAPPPVAPPPLPRAEQPREAAPPPVPPVSKALPLDEPTVQVHPPVEPPPIPPPVPPVSKFLRPDEPTVEMRTPIQPPQAVPPPLFTPDDDRLSPFDTAPLPTIEPSIASPPAAPQTPASKGPGEFTRQFAPPASRRAEAEPASPFDTAPLPVIEPSIASPPPPTALGNSGVQTLQLGTPVEPRPPLPASAPAAAANEPGEFTRQFAPPVLRPSPAPAAPKEGAAPAPNEPGEFTRQFARPIQRPATEAPASPEPGEFTRQFVSPSTKPVTQKPAGAPGEFTRQFQAPQRPTPPQSPKLPPPQPGPQPGQAPGEFTQLLQAQRPAGPPPVAKPPSQTAEFSRYFESPMTPPAQSGPGQGVPLAPARLPSHPKDAGEFTQVFGRGDIPSPPPPQAPAAPPNALNANATQVFAAPRPNPPMPMAAPNLPQNAGPPSLHHGPGEYTQMFAKPASLTLGQAQPVSRGVEAVRPARNKSLLPLLLVIGAVVLLIVAVVVYFVMRQHAT